MTAKIHTVLGVIDAQDLGVTLPHEHILADFSLWFVEPQEAALRRLAYEPVAVENRSWILHNPQSCLDNTRLLDEEAAIEELILFKKEGGDTVVDLSNVNVGRNPLGLARISRATGLNIVMGTGYYVGKAQSSDYDAKTEIDIANEIITDITIGVSDSGVRAGIIGEIGCSWPLQDREKKSLRASARAQHKTGAAINVHPGWNINSPMEILIVLADSGADTRRVAISHIDSIIYPLETRCELLERGCYLEYDFFGGYPFNDVRRYGPLPRPCDRERIEQIKELINGGYLRQILVSQDIASKMKYTRYGGGGYAHILRNIVPQMLARGITGEQIHIILVENPKRLLSLA
jgi:phosphotriesterase-related protein